MSPWCILKLVWSSVPSSQLRCMKTSFPSRYWFYSISSRRWWVSSLRYWVVFSPITLRLWTKPNTVYNKLHILVPAHLLFIQHLFTLSISLQSHGSLPPRNCSSISAGDWLFSSPSNYCKKQFWSQPCSYMAPIQKFLDTPKARLFPMTGSSSLVR